MENKPEHPSLLRVALEGSISVALAMVLSFIKLRLPQGGSISIVMVPLVFYALLRGPLAGLIAGATFGILHSLQTPFLVHPLQYLLDYPMAYGSSALAGLLSRPWSDPVRVYGACIAAMTGRFACHVLSGVLFISLYLKTVPANPLLFSLTYNAAYLVPDTVLLCIALTALLPRLNAYRKERSDKKTG